MKACSSCKNILEEEDFHFRNKSAGIRKSRCRACSAKWAKNHYRVNTAWYVEKASNSNTRQRLLLRIWVQEYLQTHPCVDCGETDAIVLQFDHVRGVKINSVSHMVAGSVGLGKLKTEVAKCEVRCANCHVRKTALQFGWHQNLRTHRSRSSSG